MCVNVPRFLSGNCLKRPFVDLTILAVVGLAAITPNLAVAQIQTATLIGTVRDTSGAVIPGASVTVVNTGTQFRSATLTSSEGNYYVPYLSPGSYQISVEA